MLRSRGPSVSLCVGWDICRSCDVCAFCVPLGAIEALHSFPTIFSFFVTAMSFSQVCVFNAFPPCFLVLVPETWYFYSFNARFSDKRRGKINA